MSEKFNQKLFQKHQKCDNFPANETVQLLFHKVVSLLFPNFSNQRLDSLALVENKIESIKNRLENILIQYPALIQQLPNIVGQEFVASLEDLEASLQLDVEAIYLGDPAAKSKAEIIRSYPGFYAIAAYRIAHIIQNLKVLVLPRIITELAHHRTGIDIHPGAKIGHSFCIDHGTGIVIGETTVIGNKVKIYQGVTLGALSIAKEDADYKRHPTIEDSTVIYANATILGGDTVIGHNSIIGGNSWITKSIAPYSTVYYISGDNQVEKIKA